LAGIDLAEDTDKIMTTSLKDIKKFYNYTLQRNGNDAVASETLKLSPFTVIDLATPLSVIIVVFPSHHGLMLVWLLAHQSMVRAPEQGLSVLLMIPLVHISPVAFSGNTN